MSDLDNLLSDDYTDDEATTEETTEHEAEEEAQEVAATEEAVSEEGKASEKEEPAQEAEQEDGKTVPLAALQSERETNRELKRRLEALERQQQQPRQEEQQQPPDFYENPDQRMTYERSQIEQQMNQRHLQQSRFFAEREFGKEEVDAAYAYFDQHPEQSQALLNEPSPFHAAVEFYRKQKVAEEIGADPEAYKQRILQEAREEARKEYEADAVTKSVKSAAEQKSPSLAGETNLGSRQGSEWSGPTSLDNILAGS